MRYALLALLLVGCSEKKEEQAFTCATRVECPNQKAPPTSKVDECNDAAFEEACGASYQAYFECFRHNEVCDGRGQLDVDASVAPCTAQFATWSQCVGLDAGVDTSVQGDTAVAPDTNVEDVKSDVKSDATDAKADG